jgi:hypothetical protein
MLLLTALFVPAATAEGGGMGRPAGKKAGKSRE